MIEQITIENFKSLKSVDLKLGRLNLFIGTNASGKSNFFDALRTLQGVGYGFTVQEILDGKPKSATSEVWDPIRGGSTNALFQGNGEAKVKEHKHIKFTTKFENAVEYFLAFDPEQGSVCAERLTASTDIYNSGPDTYPYITNNPDSPVLEARYYSVRSKGRAPHLQFEKGKPILHQLPRRPEFAKKHETAIRDTIRELSNMQRLDPSPAILRGYSQAHTIQRMGERGENFAALVKTICGDPALKEAYVSWLKELRPAEVEDVATLSGAVGEPLFSLREKGKQFPAQVLSDGTLRFAAITAAFFQPDMPAILTVEEIENGIHASRLRLLVELLRSQAMQGKTQIMATTHSPIILAWLKPEEYKHTFFCKRDENTGESRILPLTSIPHFNEVVARTPITDLFAEGWLEAAL